MKKNDTRETDSTLEGADPTRDPQKDAFIAELFETQGLPLVKYLTARFKNPDEAREVAQEAWLRLYRMDNPHALANPKAFLYQTANNLSIDRLRRAHLERRHAAEDEEEPDYSVEASVEAEQALKAVEAALYELPTKCRQAFVMHRRNGMSYPDIAQELAVSVSMVEKYIIRALKHLRSVRRAGR